MGDVKDFIDSFWNGLSSTTMTFFDKYTFSLLELFITAAIVSIIAYFLWRLFNG